MSPAATMAVNDDGFISRSAEVLRAETIPSDAAEAAAAMFDRAADELSA